ncbi:MAG: hypothetical protein ACRDJI_10040 [Actinomycetota bacterium]
MNHSFGSGWKILFAGLVALLLLGACGDDDDEPGNAGGDTEAPARPIAVTISTHDFKFDAPESISAGLVEIVVSNRGKEAHEVQLMKLHEGVTFDEFFKTAKKDDSGLDSIALADPAGGVGSTAGIPPGYDLSVTNELDPGSYALVCFVHGHNEKGMIAPFEVTESDAAAAEPPDVDGQISLSDYEIILPDDFSGSGTFEFVNNGPDFHEVAIYKLDASLEEAQKYLDSPKAFDAPPPGGEPQSAGLVSGIQPATSAFATLDLDPGTYVMVCFFPDEEGTPHAFHGMYTAFEVP